jgi:hypothetical protein
MRTAMLLLAVILGLAMPAQAQDIPSGVRALIDRMEAARAAPPMAVDAGPGSPRAAPLMLIGPAEAQPSADRMESAATAGWVYYRLSVCGAAIVGNEQYTFIITTNGLVAASQSSYAMGVIAANCASGKTFAVYIEADGQTVTAIGSFANG